MQATKRITVTVPLEKATAARRLAKRENRSVGALMRDALKEYLRSRSLLSTLDVEWLDGAIADAHANPLTDEELVAEEKRLQRYGLRQSQKHGISENDV